jgi:hypothetical protein
MVFFFIFLAMMFLILFFFIDYIEVSPHSIHEILADHDECLLHQQSLDLILQLSEVPLLVAPLLKHLPCGPLDRLSLPINDLLVDRPSGLSDHVEGSLRDECLTLVLLPLGLTAGDLLCLLLLELLLEVLRDVVALEVGLVLHSGRRDDLGSLLLRLLHWRAVAAVPRHVTPRCHCLLLAP